MKDNSLYYTCQTKSYTRTNFLETPEMLTAPMTDLIAQNIMEQAALENNLLRARSNETASDAQSGLTRFLPEWAQHTENRSLPFEQAVPKVMALLADEVPAIVQILKHGSEPGTVLILDAQIGCYEVDACDLSVPTETAEWYQRQARAIAHVLAGGAIFSGGGCRASNFYSASRCER